jgi:hypothetical protein
MGISRAALADWGENIDSMNRLRITILQVLRESGRFLLPEEVLATAVQLKLRSPGSLTECREVLRQLETDGLVLSLQDPFTGGLKWRLTDEGRATLLEAGV